MEIVGIFVAVGKRLLPKYIFLGICFHKIDKNSIMQKSQFF